MVEQKSKVIELLDLVFLASGKKPFSWSRVNGAMQSALSIAIESGFDWDITDWSYVVGHYSSGHWIGAETERWFSKMVSSENSSAIAAFESHKNRLPFIADNVHVQHGLRASSRLCVGAAFSWKGDEVTVNSFANDGSYINATVGKKRFKISRQDIFEDRAERKERDQLFERLSKRSESEPGVSKSILDDLGISKRSEKANVSIEKLREVAERYAA